MEEEMIFAMRLTDINQYQLRTHLICSFNLPYNTELVVFPNEYILRFKKNDRLYSEEKVSLRFKNNFIVMEEYSYKKRDVTEYFIDSLKEIYYKYFYGNEVYNKMLLEEDTKIISPYAEIIRAL